MSKDVFCVSKALLLQGSLPEDEQDLSFSLDEGHPEQQLVHSIFYFIYFLLPFICFSFDFFQLYFLLATTPLVSLCAPYSSRFFLWDTLRICVCVHAGRGRHGCQFLLHCPTPPLLSLSFQVVIRSRLDQSMEESRELKVLFFFFLFKQNIRHRIKFNKQCQTY